MSAGVRIPARESMRDPSEYRADALLVLIGIVGVVVLGLALWGSR